MKVVFSIAFCFTLLSVNAQKDYPFVKEDNISKTYPAGNSLNIDNQFGKVEVITWNSNQIKVDVHIKVSATNNQGYAEELFNSIKVSDEKNGNDIFFKTSVEPNNRKCNSCSNNMSIDYTVHLPADTKLSIKNSFGGIVVPDYTGELSIESKFGSLTAQTLSNIKKLHVEFGSATIASLENVDASFKFSSVELNSLSGDNKLSIEFCNTTKIGLSGSIVSLSLNESYSTVNLKPAPNLQASYKINTDFGSFKNRSNIDISRTDEPKQYGPDSKKTYEGKSGNGSAKINIKSSFGKIIIGEPQPGDIKEKKQKNKDKDNDNDSEEI